MTFIRPFLQVLACGISFFIILPALFIIEPFYRIRITPLHTARIGHLAMNTQRYVASCELDGPERRTLRIIFGARPCNRQLMNMWKQRVTIVDSVAVTAFYHFAIPVLGKSRFFQALEGEMHNFREMDYNGPLLTFSDDEEAAGKRLLDEMGIGDRPGFVCFIARDSGYHANRGFPVTSPHRNSDVGTYLKAAQHIVSMGAAAVRMGAGVEAPLPDGLGPGIVDYAYRHHSDFGDIYLIAKCRFFLASAAGIIHVAPVFKTPVAAVNMLPYIPAPTGRHSLYIPKILTHLDTGEMVTFAEVHRVKGFSWEYDANRIWDKHETYQQHGFSIYDNSPEEILDLCLDMEDRLNGIEPDAETRELQLLLKRRFLSGGPYDLEHIPDIGPRFARKYDFLITAD
jgi:putative glycosyltransferase (TIGR04372 family)